MKTYTEPTTIHGTCHDCAQGTFAFKVDPTYGFAQFVDVDGPQHWYCRYCGSNHVDIRDAEGNIIFEQGDLYEVQ